MLWWNLSECNGANSFGFAKQRNSIGRLITQVCLISASRFLFVSRKHSFVEG